MKKFVAVFILTFGVAANASMRQDDGAAVVGIQEETDRLQLQIQALLMENIGLRRKLMEYEEREASRATQTMALRIAEKQGIGTDYELRFDERGQPQFVRRQK